MFQSNDSSSGALTVLFSQQPDGQGVPFIELRRWETATGEHADLILEVGHVDAAGDLVTTSRVLPFYFDIGEVFRMLAVEGVS